jgi:hypothetical protein
MTMYELKLKPGMRPLLVNPKPQTPVRTAELTSQGWRLSTEEYSAAVEMPLRASPDPADDLDDLRRLVARLRGHSVVFAARGDKVGAVVVGCNLPDGYVPRLLERPESC